MFDGAGGAFGREWVGGDSGGIEFAKAWGRARFAEAAAASEGGERFAVGRGSGGFGELHFYGGAWDGGAGEEWGFAGGIEAGGAYSDAGLAKLVGGILQGRAEVEGSRERLAQEDRAKGRLRRFLLSRLKPRPTRRRISFASGLDKKCATKRDPSSRKALLWMTAKNGGAMRRQLSSPPCRVAMENLNPTLREKHEGWVTRKF